MQMVQVWDQVWKGLLGVGEKWACQVGMNIKDTCGMVVMLGKIWEVLSLAMGARWEGLVQRGKEREAPVKGNGDLKGGGGRREVVREWRTGRGVTGIGWVRGMDIATSVGIEASVKRIKIGTGQTDLLAVLEIKRTSGPVLEKTIMESAVA